MKTKIIFLYLLIFPAILSIGGNIPSLTIRGKIIDSDTLKPLSEVNVSILSETNSIGTLTNHNGELYLWNLPNGSTELYITLDGYHPKTISIDEIRSDTDETVIIKLDSNKKKHKQMKLQAQQKDQ